jgi:hypothetical protein
VVSTIVRSYPPPLTTPDPPPLELPLDPEVPPDDVPEPVEGGAGVVSTGCLAGGAGVVSTGAGVVSTGAGVVSTGAGVVVTVGAVDTVGVVAGVV